MYDIVHDRLPAGAGGIAGGVTGVLPAVVGGGMLTLVVVGGGGLGCVGGGDAVAGGCATVVVVGGGGLLGCVGGGDAVVGGGCATEVVVGGALLVVVGGAEEVVGGADEVVAGALEVVGGADEVVVGAAEVVVGGADVVAGVAVVAGGTADVGVGGAVSGGELCTLHESSGQGYLCDSIRMSATLQAWTLLHAHVRKQRDTGKYRANGMLLLLHTCCIIICARLDGAGTHRCCVCEVPGRQVDSACQPTDLGPDDLHDPAQTIK